MGASIRDNAWLLSRLNELWENHFLDVPQRNRVFIAFGRRARLRFGSIQMERHSSPVTTITMTSMFKSSRVPAAVVDYTIAHELVHYAHGFSSPLTQKLRHPHQGGVVHRELKARGLGELIVSYKKWIKEYRRRLWLTDRSK